MFDDFLDEDAQDLLDDSDAEKTSGPAGLRPARANPDLYGLETHEAQLLDLFYENRMPHALIFAGPAGVGKASFAFRLARFLFKHGAMQDQGGLFGDAPPRLTSMHMDEEDPIFRKVAGGAYPELRVYERPMNERTGVQKDNLDVDTVREIAPFLRMTTSDGGWRVVIVDEADTMTRQAQNAILKILEEPPPHSLLILICNRLGAMIPTIRSRCRTIQFPLLDKQILHKLIRTASPTLKEADLALVSDLCDGSAGQALKVIEDGGLEQLHAIRSFLAAFPDLNWTDIHLLAEKLARKEAGVSYSGFTHGFEWIVRHILKYKATNGALPLPDFLKEEGLSPLIHHYTLEQWIAICENLREHFMSIDNSNLDRRQGVIGAFSLLGGQAG